MTTLANKHLRHLGLAAAIALAALHAPAPARADNRDNNVPHAPLLPKYHQECAACHLGYPPTLLPATSWQRLMDTLPQHFGTDASLDAASVREIGAWLQAQAASGRRSPRDSATPPEDRITRSAWFLREHREVSAVTWAWPGVKSPSNCTACHTRAEQGDFSERTIRIRR